jgi:hypothetical protein
MDVHRVAPEEGEDIQEREVISTVRGGGPKEV